MRAIAKAANEAIRTNRLKHPEHEYLSTSVVQQLLNAGHRRQPKEALVKSFHALAEATLGRGEIIPWEDLNALRRALPRRSPTNIVDIPVAHCPECGSPCPSCGAAEQDISVTVPSENSSAAPPVVAPVFEQQGDRRNNDSPAAVPPTWSAITIVTRDLTAGKLENVNGLIHHASLEARAEAKSDNAALTC